MTTRNPRVLSDMPIPPGEVLAEELEARGMTQKELAARLGRPAQAINEIIKAKKAITPETAIGLEQVLGIDAQFWTNLEADYRLTLARIVTGTHVQLRCTLSTYRVGPRGTNSEPARLFQPRLLLPTTPRWTPRCYRSVMERGPSGRRDYRGAT